MRVLHVSTATSGGAALAALRLVEAQRRIGIDALLLTQERGVVIGPTGRRTVSSPRRLAQRGTTAVDLSLSRDRQYFFSPLEFGVLEIGDIGSLVPDVVHIHNWFNFFPWRLAYQLKDQGIVLVATAHDERLMTGGCHTTLGCDSYLTGCRMCPQSRIHSVAQRPALRLHETLIESEATIVAPSAWLSSRLLRRFEGTAVTICEIPNGLDANIFHPPTTLRAGEITLGAMTGKADELLQASLDELAALLGFERAQRISLRVAGLAGPPSWPGPVVPLGYLRTDAERANFFRSCDISVAPTHADNFPNVNLESTFSGAAVLTCDVGGSGEVVRATGRGVAVDASAQAMAHGAAELLASIDELRRSAWTAWAAAKDLYGYGPVAREYSAVYAAVTGGSDP
jgi:glycosyltransferase involved in cell wall biosynthesis